ncbi:PEP/pyruvate-binding domain-containing protein [Kribbella sp. NPDC048915]|uniref:PEP/pyruvate-binding domain-containing protein n=1 Tax=Kribbella sp. NPDC048915 TaxID=3155148 RepID=UPI00340577AA
MLVPLAAATVEQCGAKAATLGVLLRNGLPVPDGVVVPFSCADSGLAEWLAPFGDAPVAVRSSAANEDTALTSAAGQHDSFLGVQGVAAVVDAVRACRESSRSARATAYRAGGVEPAMAVIVQRQVDADVSGVLFTGVAGTLIESSWGLGPSVVEGRVTPDRYEVVDGAVTRTVGDKRTSLERDTSGLAVRRVPADRRRTASLTDATARQLADLGGSVTTVLGGGAQDIEWAIAGSQLWILQARPVTVQPPAPGASGLAGVPGSHGTATGPARVVRGPADFSTVRPGDILVCPYTDPAWTPLLSIAAGVVTEHGGILSHAAIVAREKHIPAVLAVPQATTRIRSGETITIDGTTGAIS